MTWLRLVLGLLIGAAVAIVVRYRIEDSFLRRGPES